MNHHERMQDDFYRNFEGRNWYIESDYLADQVPVFESLKSANESAHGEAIRPLVRANRYARQNRLTATLLGVTHDDIH
jgi:hypothetical protein